MENRKTKKEIVQMLLKRNFEENDEEELINMLTREPIAVDVDKQSDEKRTFGDKVADKIAEIAGSWTFILCMILFLGIISNKYIGAIFIVKTYKLPIRGLFIPNSKIGFRL